MTNREFGGLLVFFAAVLFAGAIFRLIWAAGAYLEMLTRTHG